VLVDRLCVQMQAAGVLGNGLQKYHDWWTSTLLWSAPHEPARVALVVVVISFSSTTASSLHSRYADQAGLRFAFVLAPSVSAP